MKPGYKFFIAKQQLTKDVDIYVNIQLDPDMKNAYIMGWINKNDTLTYPIMASDKMINTALGIPLTDLKPIYSLFGDIDIEVPTITINNTGYGSYKYKINTVCEVCGWGYHEMYNVSTF